MIYLILCCVYCIYLWIINYLAYKFKVPILITFLTLANYINGWNRIKKISINSKNWMYCVSFSKTQNKKKAWHVNVVLYLAQMVQKILSLLKVDISLPLVSNDVPIPFIALVRACMGQCNQLDQYQSGWWCPFFFFFFLIWWAGLTHNMSS